MMRTRMMMVGVFMAVLRSILMGMFMGMGFFTISTLGGGTQDRFRF